MQPNIYSRGHLQQNIRRGPLFIIVHYDCVETSRFRGRCERRSTAYMSRVRRNEASWRVSRGSPDGLLFPSDQRMPRMHGGSRESSVRGQPLRQHLVSCVPADPIQRYNFSSPNPEPIVRFVGIADSLARYQSRAIDKLLANASNTAWCPFGCGRGQVHTPGTSQPIVVCQ